MPSAVQYCSSISGVKRSLTRLALYRETSSKDCGLPDTVQSQRPSSFIAEISRSMLNQRGPFGPKIVNRVPLQEVAVCGLIKIITPLQFRSRAPWQIGPYGSPPLTKLSK